VKDVAFEDLDKAFQDLADEKPEAPPAEQSDASSAPVSTPASQKSSSNGVDLGYAGASFLHME
jgi:hypothetical protein